MPITSKLIPTEDQEQIEFVKWLRLHDIAHHHSANEVRIDGRHAHFRRGRNKALGQSKGFPDLIVFLLPWQTFNGCPETIFIEMKRTKGSATSPEQEGWVERLRRCGHIAQVCKGANEAKLLVELYTVKTYDETLTF